MISLDSTGDILVENEKVGQIVYDKNHLEKIEVTPRHQNKGYGTDAIRKYLEQMSTKGFDRVTTTPATSPAIVHIFSKLDFRQVDDTNEHDFLDTVNNEMYKVCFIKEL